MREAHYDLASAMFDDNELEQASRETGGKPKAEALAMLAALEKLLSGHDAA
jgi:hypothetical protein